MRSSYFKTKQASALQIVSFAMVYCKFLVTIRVSKIEHLFRIQEGRWASRLKNSRNAVTDRDSKHGKETYLYSLSSSVPRRARRGERRDWRERLRAGRGEESGECGGERSWRGSRRIRISFRRHVRISTWRLVEALSGKGPVKPQKQKKPLE
jgi:hypothetical protein